MYSGNQLWEPRLENMYSDMPKLDITNTVYMVLEAILEMHF